MSHPPQIGILYDANVHNYPIVSKVMWWHAAFVEWHICSSEPDLDLIESIEASYDRFPSVIRQRVEKPVFCRDLPLDDLDGLVVIRSHPEMFGPEIQRFRARATEFGFEIWTIETSADSAAWAKRMECADGE